MNPQQQTVQTKKYVLSKFPLRKIKRDRIVFMIGRRGSGKTTGIIDLLYQHRDIDMGIVICGTEESAEQYRSIFPDSFVYGEYSEQTLLDAIQVQKVRLHEWRMGKRKKKPGIVVLADDVMYGKPLKTKLARNLFMNGRHWNILFIATSQYCMDVGPDLRGQIDYVWLYRVNSNQEREKLFATFGGHFPNKETFVQIYSQCCVNYGCMVIDNTAQSDKLEDCVFWHKSPLRPDVRIGSKAMWRFHNKEYDRAKAMQAPDIFGSLQADGSVGNRAEARGRAKAAALIDDKRIRVIKKGSKQKKKQSRSRSSSVSRPAPVETGGSRRHF